MEEPKPRPRIRHSIRVLLLAVAVAYVLLGIFKLSISAFLVLAAALVIHFILDSSL